MVDDQESNEDDQKEEEIMEVNKLKPFSIYFDKK